MGMARAPKCDPGHLAILAAISVVLWLLWNHPNDDQGDHHDWNRRARAVLNDLSLEQKASLLSHSSSHTGELPAFNHWSECIHGVVEWSAGSLGATVFPQPLTLASSFDKELLGKVASAVSDEARAKFNRFWKQHKSYNYLNCFGPHINLFRDPRWGRGSETYGEDPYLSAELAKIFVRKLQGDDKTFVKVGATCKHFLGYSFEGQGGVTRMSFDAELSPQDMADTYLPAFQACVGEAGARSVMCSYNSVQGVPSCANADSLQRLLRQEMHFDGFVVTDCGAAAVMEPFGHNYTQTFTEAVAASIKAGVNLFCDGRERVKEGVMAAVQAGQLTEDDVDQTLVPVLVERFRLGDEVDLPILPWRHLTPERVVGSSEHLRLAREAAQKGIVLLKNQNHTLPLTPERLGATRKLVVLGPLADSSEHLLGNYYGYPASPPVKTPLGALREILGARMPGISVRFSLGAHLLGGPDPIDAAIKETLDADVVLLVVGSSIIDDGPHYTRATGGLQPGVMTEGESMDRKSLELPGGQMDLIKAVASRTSVPHILIVMIHGGPLDVSWAMASDRVGAIVSAGYPGQVGAEALVDILLGDLSPSGRLPVTWYYNNYTKMIALADMSMRKGPGRTYRFLDPQVQVLYPFGYGLSYTDFNYEVKALKPPHCPGYYPRCWCQALPTAAYVTVEVDVVNRGPRRGEEVVLLYLTYINKEPAGVGPPGKAKIGSIADQQGRPRYGGGSEEHWGRCLRSSSQPKAGDPACISQKARRQSRRLRNPTASPLKMLGQMKGQRNQHGPSLPEVEEVDTLGVLHGVHLPGAPLKSLRGFQRTISLDVGKSQKLTFPLTCQDFQLAGEDGRLYTMAGWWRVEVGGLKVYVEVGGEVVS